MKSKRPKPSVFDLRGTREAPVPAAVRAADFGSDNKPWVKPRPARRRWQPTVLTLVAGLVLGSMGLAAAHAVHGGRRAPSRNTMYQAAIATAPARSVSAPVIVPTDPDDVPGTAAATVAAIGEMAAARDEAALTPGAAAATRPIQKPASTARRKAVRHETARERLAGAAPASGVAGDAAHATGERKSDASPAASRSAHAAVGMTASEFSQWLAATREPARSGGASTVSPSPDLHVALPTHVRVTDAATTDTSAQ